MAFRNLNKSITSITSITAISSTRTSSKSRIYKKGHLLFALTLLLLCKLGFSQSACFNKGKFPKATYPAATESWTSSITASSTSNAVFQGGTVRSTTA